MFTSFLLARRFSIKIFLPLITAVILFISYFSVVLSFEEVTGRYYLLSFPLYSIEKPDSEIPLLFRSYEVYFLNYRIYRWSHGPISYVNGISVLTRLVLSVDYFLFINIAGAILGYGLSKAKSIWRYFGRRKELLLVTIIMVVSIIGVSAVLWYKIQEPKHVIVTAIIAEKDILYKRFKSRHHVFLMDNGDLVEVSIAEYNEYEIGDMYTYCTCQVIRL